MEAAFDVTGTRRSYRLAAMMLSEPPPRRVTFEHESGHAVVVRAGGGTVKYVDLGSQASGTMHSLGHTEWSPPVGDQHLLVTGVAAGPAQTRVTVERLDLNPRYAEQSVELEARTFAELLSRKNGDPPNVPGARAFLGNRLPTMEAYLRDDAVQQAVQTTADYLEQAEANGGTRVEWSELENLVDWDSLPPVPQAAS